MEGVFKQCFHDHYEGLHRYAFTIVKEDQQAKDIVQTAFLKLWEKRDQVDLLASGRSYLFTSVYHLSLNSIRDGEIKKQHKEQIASGTPEISYDPAEQKELKERIQEAINSLPPRCKEVFCKSRLEGKKYGEIATEMNISVKTVEVQMGKALKKLKEMLSDVITAMIIFVFLPW